MTDLQEAFGELYELHVQRVYRYVHRKVRDQATAEDITSEVFMKALAAIDRYEDRGHLLAWLYRIASNEVIDHYRERTAENIDDLELPDDGLLEEMVIRRASVRRIGNLIGALPERQREAMILYFQEDMRPSDIGAVMGLSNGAVRILVHRGVTHLRKVA